MNHPRDTLPLYEDYPFFFVTAGGGFHGRTAGALALSSVRPVNKRGYPSLSRVRRITFNGDPAELEALIDFRGLDEILAADGGVAAVVAAGQIPRELLAGLVVEPFQGEAGYRLAQVGWLQAIVDLCQRSGVSVIADEIQSFARTGKVFACEHYGIQPDIIAVSKASVIGIALASSRYAEWLPLGWHSTTWGGGKVLDNTYAWTALDTYLNYVDPLFGMTYIENQGVKGEYIRAAFDWLICRHPDLLIGATGLGGMWGFAVRDRDRVCATAWRHGLKLLSCGVTREVSAVRALFLADVLTKEIDCFARLLDAVLTEVETTSLSQAPGVVSST